MAREKMLPSNEQAERAVLGSLLIDGEAMADIPFLTAEDFASLLHRRIYQAMHYLATTRIRIDLLTVTDELERGDGSETDFYPALESLVNGVPTSSHLVYYAHIVERCARLRRIIQAAADIAAIAYEESDEAEERAERIILEATRQRGQISTIEPKSLGDLLPAYLNDLDMLHGPTDTPRKHIQTGYPELDRLLGDLAPGDLYVPAARTSVGKSALVQNVAYNVAKAGGRVGFFSLEMPIARLIDRFIGIDGSVQTQALMTPGRMRDRDWDVIANVDDLASLGIFLSYCPGCYISDFARMASRFVRQESLDLVIVDYLQLLRAKDGQGRRLFPREMEVAEITRELKRIAGELGVPIMAPAQINREIEHRAAYEDRKTGLKFKMPQLSDVRESGEIEQSSDVLLLMTRAEEREEFVKVIVAKARNGPRGELLLKFEADYTRFCSIEGEERCN